MNPTIDEEHTCSYCNKSFRRESTLVAHMCEPKRRHTERNERSVQLGYHAYREFYETSQGSAKFKTHDEFIKSPYYRAFVKFGRYAIGVKAINPNAFIKWLLNNNKKIDHWCKDKNYEEYLNDYLRHEPVSDALVRGIEYGVAWAEKHNMQSKDFLRYGNHNGLVYAITTGRISPWVLYSCDSGTKFLGELNKEHIRIVWPIIDPDFWQKKFLDYVADAEYAKEILKQAGL